MDLKKIEGALKGFLEEKGIRLFEINYYKKDSILEVLLDEELKMAELESLSAEISDFLDNYDDEFPDKYFLDVSNVGAERKIRNEAELKAAIGSYIYVRDRDKKEYYGTLQDYLDGELLLEVMDKNKARTIRIAYENVKNVRYAVKF